VAVDILVVLAEMETHLQQVLLKAMMVEQEHNEAENLEKKMAEAEAVLVAQE
jgi:hypothetical protein